MRRESRIHVTVQLLIFIVAIFVLIGVGISVICPRMLFKETIVSTVTDKEVKHYKGEDDKYLIFTKDDNGKSYVFEDVDSWLPPKFNSSDVYALIEIGTKYEFKVRGVRIPIFSQYQNIYKVKEVEDADN